MATQESSIMPREDVSDEDVQTWKPDLSTTEESFRGWGGSAAEDALTKEFLHNIEQARGRLELPRILGLVSRFYTEKYSDEDERVDVHEWLHSQAY